MRAEAASSTWLQSCSASLDKLRVVKSGTEVLAMRRACDASAKAYRKVGERERVAHRGHLCQRRAQD